MLTVSEKFDQLQAIKKQLSSIENAVECEAEVASDLQQLLVLLSKHDSQVHRCKITYSLDKN